MWQQDVAAGGASTECRHEHSWRRDVLVGAELLHLVVDEEVDGLPRANHRGGAHVGLGQRRSLRLRAQLHLHKHLARRLRVVVEHVDVAGEGLAEEDAAKGRRKQHHLAEAKLLEACQGTALQAIGLRQRIAEDVIGLATHGKTRAGARFGEAHHFERERVPIFLRHGAGSSAPRVVQPAMLLTRSWFPRNRRNADEKELVQGRRVSGGFVVALVAAPVSPQADCACLMPSLTSSSARCCLLANSFPLCRTLQLQGSCILTTRTALGSRRQHLQLELANVAACIAFCALRAFAIAVN